MHPETCHKFILSDYVSDYKTRLSFLDLLPLMYIFELNDILFCVHMLKSPTRGFNILDYIKFSDSCTRSSGARKMVHNLSINNSSRHFYYNRLPRLWNSLLPLDLTESTATIKRHLRDFLLNHFIDNFDSDNSCSFHYLCPCASCGFNALVFNLHASASISPSD